MTISPSSFFGAGAAQGKREHVGRLVVVEELLVEPMDGRIVHEGQADRRGGDALALQDGFGDLAQPAAVDGARSPAGWRS